MDHRYLAIIIFVAAILLEKLALYLFLPMLSENGAVRPNYRKDLIPVAAGLTFPLVLITCFLLMTFLESHSDYRFMPYLLAVVVMALVGFVDDILGSRDTLGFRGHFSRLIKERKMTTGALKALTGGLVSFFIAWSCYDGIISLIVNTLIIALFTNSMNLFDLRPGRCVKAFLIMFLPLAYFAWDQYLLFIPLFGAVLAYFRYDLKARAMMGDTGSNVLGVTLGVMTVYGLGFTARLAVLAALILLHLYTEKYSITKTIEKSRVLKTIDMLGRGE
ncbi:MAG: hypothetical protein ACM3MK_05075 [Chitinophagales bacterium]